MEELTTIQTQLYHDPANGDLLQKEIKCKDHYGSITHSAISLLKQQGKVDWIAYGDELLRFFMSRIKQRKAMTCIYTLRDHNDQWVEGFENVAEVMTTFYQGLLGEKENHRTRIDHQVLN